MEAGLLRNFFIQVYCEVSVIKAHRWERTVIRGQGQATNYHLGMPQKVAFLNTFFFIVLSFFFLHNLVLEEFLLILRVLQMAST